MLQVWRHAMLAFVIVLDWVVRAAIHIVFCFLDTLLMGLQVVFPVVHVLAQSLGGWCHVLFNLHCLSCLVSGCLVPNGA